MVINQVKIKPGCRTRQTAAGQYSREACEACLANDMRLWVYNTHFGVFNANNLAENRARARTSKRIRPDRRLQTENLRPGVMAYSVDSRSSIEHTYFRSYGITAGTNKVNSAVTTVTEK